MANDELINDVSDTALWIAGYRAQESARPDAVFKDPLAARLAGQRGIEMVAATPNTQAMAFAMVVRTAAIDRLVEMALERGVDAVINLGAGLDTRPYRMNLPVNLRWIEVDFDHMIAYKNRLLENEKPACQLQRIAADLSQDAMRRQVLAQLGAGTKNALIITEGVVAYLTSDQARKLSSDLYSIPAFRYWIKDYARGKHWKKNSERLNRILKRAPLRFDVEEPLPFFQQDGWKICEDLHILDEGDRIGRSLPIMFPWSILSIFMGKKIREVGNSTYGYVMFCK